MRRMPALVTSLGFHVERLQSHDYIEAADPGYMLTIVDRGADTLASDGTSGPELAAALKAEARHRVERGEFFGHIAYASLLARKQS